MEQGAAPASATQACRMYPVRPGPREPRATWLTFHRSSQPPRAAGKGESPSRDPASLPAHRGSPRRPATRIPAPSRPARPAPGRVRPAPGRAPGSDRRPRPGVCCLSCLVDHLDGPLAIKGHEPLVEPHVGLQLGLLTQERREEPQAGHVLAQHRQADRQRGREQQPQRPPEPGPEHRRDQQAQGRDPRRLAVDHRLQEAVERRSRRRRRGRRPPAAVPSPGSGRTRRPAAATNATAGPDVGDEPQHRRQTSPEHRERHADHPQPQPDDQPETRVDQREHREVAADPLADLLHRPGRQADLAVAEEPDDPVAELVSRPMSMNSTRIEHEAADPEELQVGPDGRAEPILELRLRDDLHLLDRDRLLRLAGGAASPSWPSPVRPCASAGRSSIAARA